MNGFIGVFPLLEVSDNCPSVLYALVEEYWPTILDRITGSMELTTSENSSSLSLENLRNTDVLTGHVFALLIHFAFVFVPFKIGYVYFIADIRIV